MNAASMPVSSARGFDEMPFLLRGETNFIQSWIAQWSAARITFHIGVIVLGTAAFGAAIGFWRAPQQALFTAVKLPLIILLTTTGNGLLNGMLAPLLGARLAWRQSFLAILLSFTIAAAVLGAASPLIAYLIWNAPALRVDGPNGATHSFILLTLVAVIAFAGVVGNLRLMQLLRLFSGDRAVARRTLWAWLAGNLLLGSQLSWILRPFVGSPGLPVQFLRDDALNGNFFEAVIRAMRLILG